MKSSPRLALGLASLGSTVALLGWSVPVALADNDTLGGYEMYNDCGQTWIGKASTGVNYNPYASQLNYGGYTTLSSYQGSSDSSQGCVLEGKYFLYYSYAVYGPNGDEGDHGSRFAGHDASGDYNRNNAEILGYTYPNTDGQWDVYGYSSWGQETCDEYWYLYMHATEDVHVDPYDNGEFSTGGKPIGDVAQATIENKLVLPAAPVHSSKTVPTGKPRVVAQLKSVLIPDGLIASSASILPSLREWLTTAHPAGGQYPS
jgi:hypothetical protein